MTVVFPVKPLSSLTPRMEWVGRMGKQTRGPLLAICEYFKWMSRKQAAETVTALSLSKSGCQCHRYSPSRGHFLSEPGCRSVEGGEIGLPCLAGVEG